MMNLRFRHLVLLLGLLVIPPSWGSEPDKLFGRYEVVAIRKASLVHSGPHDVSLDDVKPGSRFTFGGSNNWLWGTRCRSWGLQQAAEISIPADDEMLSDTQVTAASLYATSPDHRLNQHLLLHCGSDPVSEARILRVDERVLLTTSPSGQSYLVMEKVPSKQEVLATQQALAEMKNYEGAINGEMNAATRRGLALLAGHLGAKYDFNASALSNNLLEAMGISQAGTADLPTWTDDQITKEMQRFQFSNTSTESGSVSLIVSGFFESGINWPQLENEYARQTSPAWQQLRAIQDFLASLPNTEYSVLADRLNLLNTERQGDWMCFTGINCYPKGVVVQLEPIGADKTQEICSLLRENGWFCATRGDMPLTAEGASDE
jgi:hypothetical protein